MRESVAKIPTEEVWSSVSRVSSFQPTVSDVNKVDKPEELKVQLEQGSLYAVVPTREQFSTFLTARQHMILGVAARILRNREDALDVLQEVAIRLFRHWHEIDGTKNTEGWIYRMTVNECCRWLQRNHRHTVDDSGIALDTIPSEQPEPEHALHTREFQRVLATALDILSEQERVAFVLKDLEQHSGQDIAEIMGCQPTTARGYYFSARKKLASHITQNAPEWLVLLGKGGVA